MSHTKITRNFIDNLVKSIDIMEFMESAYDSDFIISKNSDWANTRCPMPDHDDGNPSFGVNTKSNTYNCFGCGATGDLIKLVQDVEGFNFVESIQKLVGSDKKLFPDSIHPGIGPHLALSKELDTYFTFGVGPGLTARGRGL